MSSQPDILVSHFLRPGSAEARKMTATSGRKLLPLLRGRDQATLSAKMLLATSAWASTKCFLTWKDKATPAGRLLFQLAPSMPRTDETGFGLWPTPRASENDQGRAADGMAWGQSSWKAQGRGATLTTAVKQSVRLWPTPRSCSAMAAENIGNRVGDKFPNLESVVERSLWPTPMAADHRDRGGPSNPAIQRRAQIGKSIELSMRVDGSLNPEWVEGLMGFPPGWTEV